MPSQPCSGRTKNGLPCGNRGVKGTVPPKCTAHGGGKPQVAAQAEANLERAFSEQLGDLVPKAMRVLEEVLDESSDDKVRISAARDILDRAGHGAVKKSQVDMTVTSGGVDVDDDIERMLAGKVVQPPTAELDGQLDELTAPADDAVDDAATAALTHVDDMPHDGGMPGIPPKPGSARALRMHDDADEAS